VPFGTALLLRIFQAVNCQATINSSLRDSGSAVPPITSHQSPLTSHLPHHPCVTINPRLIAIAIASVRPIASSLARIDLTWALTVFSLI
jgi:hypothetical protein